MGAPSEYGAVIVWWDSSSVSIWCMSGWVGVLGGRLDCEDVCLSGLPLDQWARAWARAVLEHPVVEHPEHSGTSRSQPNQHCHKHPTWSPSCASMVRYQPKYQPSWTNSVDK